MSAINLASDGTTLARYAAQQAWQMRISSKVRWTLRSAQQDTCPLGNPRGGLDKT